MNRTNASDVQSEKKVIEILIDENKLNTNNFYYLIKRLIDIIGSLFGLIILIPLFLIISLIIKKEEPKGSVFFVQERVGKNGKLFKMYKFRSMCLDAEDRLQSLLEHNEIEGAMFKIKDDPRITKIGKFIRKTSIDELPQLLNVLKGDMTLVGPRPALVREIIEYNDYQKQRLLVEQGCTGLWQVSGRNDLSFEEMIELDLLYIKKRNTYFDFKIIIKTLFLIINSRGAY